MVHFLDTHFTRVSTFQIARVGKMLPVSVLSGFGVELLLALSLITIIMWRRKIPRCIRGKLDDSF